MIAFLRARRSLARPVLCAAALLGLLGAVAVTRDRTPAPLSMATDGDERGSAAAFGAVVERAVPAPDASADTTARDDPLTRPPRVAGGTTTTRAGGSGSTTTTVGPTVPGTTPTTARRSGTDAAGDEDIGPLVGRVSDEANRPIPDICVWEGDPRTGLGRLLARTDDEGRYRAEGLRGDTVTMKMCDPDDHDFGWLAGVLGPGIDVSNGREANGDLQLVSLGGLRGRVVDTQGNPVAGACVAPWYQPWARVRTDADGRFTARHVIVGHYYDDFDSAHLYASCDGGKRMTMLFGDFYVHIGEWTDVVIRTDPTGPPLPPPGPGCCVGSGPTI